MEIEEHVRGEAALKEQLQRLMLENNELKEKITEVDYLNPIQRE